jgi:hypothetical protein
VLTAHLRQKLNTFHNRCVRTMTRGFSRGRSNISHRAPLEPMYAALGLTSIDQYISSRKLRWAGHVMRMSMARLPRKFITSWVHAPRAPGRTHFYGHDLAHELRAAGFNLDRRAACIGVSRSWVETAQHRDVCMARTGETCVVETRLQTRADGFSVIPERRRHYGRD